MSGNSNTTSYKYVPGDTICAFIRAINGDNITITSSSNKLCQTTNPLIKPDYLYINKVTIENHDTLKVYSIQDETKIDSMALQKRLPGSNWTTIDNIKPVLSLYSYTDAVVLVNQEEYEYRLIAYNSCKQTLDSSNISKNILLKLNDIGELEWTSYYTFDAGTQKYNISKSADGSTWNNESSVIENNQVEYFYTPISLENSNGNALCFCVLGIEQGVNSYGRIDTSYSNKVCAKGVFSFYVPNAFKPSGLNTVFLPSSQNLKYIGYKMTITNRWGEVFFTTQDPKQGWDGTFQDSPCQMGAYVYVINAQGEDGTTINTSGIVNLIR
jgi:gliding motility-associated-like protein